jgi:hypothetical protein
MNLEDACRKGCGTAASFRQGANLAMQGAMNTAELIELPFDEET